MTEPKDILILGTLFILGMACQPSLTRTQEKEQKQKYARVVCITHQGDTVLNVVSTGVSIGMGGFFGNGLPGTWRIYTEEREHLVTVGPYNNQCVATAISVEEAKGN